MTRATLVLSTLALAAPLASADVVHLKNGRSLEGKAEAKDDKVVLRTLHGIAIVAAADVQRIETKRCVLDDYADKLAATSLGDAESLHALASWCRSVGYASKAKEHARAAISIEPNHVGARGILGHALVAGAWVTREEALRSAGLAEHDGKVVTTEEAEKADAAAAAKSRRARLQRVVDRLVRTMAYPDAESRRISRESLEKIAEVEKIPGLKESVDKVYKYYERVAPAVQTGGGVAIIEMRFTKAELKRPIQEIKTNLGQANSTQVTIQLPELSIVGVETTVAVPLGLQGD
ncbi:MAG: hypothetical protein L0216_19485 [Planctomycetales bacterium]|nr:hypothetical protein [Planctomycetales bacterium]